MSAHRKFSSESFPCLLAYSNINDAIVVAAVVIAAAVAAAVAAVVCT